MFSFLHKLSHIHDSRLKKILPNVSVALRLLLTFPATVVSGKRSLLKLKLFKTYVRSGMAQDGLIGLAVSSIENDVTF